MNRSLIFTLSLACAIVCADDIHHAATQEATIDTHEQSEQEASKKADQTKKRIIRCFAKMAAHFFEMLEDPNNPEVLEPHLNGILAGMVSIGMEAFKKKRNIKKNRILFSRFFYVTPVR